MAQIIKLKNSATPSKVPLTTDLVLGEVAINSNDGRVYLKKDVLGVESIIDITSVQPDVQALFNSLNMTNVNVENKIGNVSHVSNLRTIYNHLFSSGVMNGCVLTDNLDGTVSITAGEGAIRAAGDDGHGTIYSAEIPAVNNLILADNSTNYIYVSYNDGLTISWGVTQAPGIINLNDIVPVYIIVRENLKLSIIDVRNQNVNHISKNQIKEFYTEPFKRKDGGSVIYNAGTLHLSCTAGAFYFQLNEFSVPALNTLGTDTFEYYKHVGGAWVETNSQIIDNLYYDNGSNLVALANNKFGVHWIYAIVGSTSGYAVVYGNQEYASIAAAQVSTTPTILPPSISGLGILIGRAIVEKGALELVEVSSAFTKTFLPTLATNHENLAGLLGGTAGDHVHLTSAELLKLTGIEAGATADQTASEILTAISTVDGTGSGLDADLLDGKHAPTGAIVGDTDTQTLTNKTINLLNNTLSGTVCTLGSTAIGAEVTTSSLAGLTNVSSSTLTSTVATGTAPLAVTSTTAVTNLNADMLDGLHSTAFQPIDGDLTAIAALAGTTGLLKKTATDTWTLDTTAYIPSSEKGAINGVATLDASGLIPTVQLPAYVDDVLEFANLAAFPVTGMTGKIYVALDTNKTYRWSGTVYVYITSGAVDSVGGFTGIITAGNLLTAISTVDGTGSGLDADLLDGKHAPTGAIVGDTDTQTLTNKTINLLNNTLSGTVCTLGSTAIGAEVTTSSLAGLTNVSSSTLTSTVATGTAPLAVTSTTAVTNLNADMLDGQHGTYFQDWTNTTNKPSPTVTLNLSGAVNGSGNTTLTSLASGTINVTTTLSSSISVSSYELTNSVLTDFTITTASVSQTPLVLGSSSAFRNIKLIIQISEGTKFQSSELNIIHDGTNAFFTEFGTIFSTSILGTFSVNIVGGNIQLLITSASVNSTAYKIQAQLIRV